MIIVTGGAGFIGSNFVRLWLGLETESVVVADKFTYAANPENLADFANDPRLIIERMDICDRLAVEELFSRYRPRAVVHLAAESHVDRSIRGPAQFVETNIVGTFALLEGARAFWGRLKGEAHDDFRFVHVSTDEVYGSLEPLDPPFTEQRASEPNSPYAASKAAADHLVRAFHRTYGLPCITTNCTNNFGPYQFPEKLIPLVILNAKEASRLPVYGDGMQVRDWVYVADHCDAVRVILAGGRVGETYNVGSRAERTNLEVVRAICRLLDELHPGSGRTHEELIEFVADRPGHDRRYAIDPSKVETELSWRPKHSFDNALRKTVQWYLANEPWCERVRSGEYRQWTELHYGTS
jgi:dTDP-glucose 4,6-dehydratase